MSGPRICRPEEASGRDVFQELPIGREVGVPV
jgi:hypothetical protein